MRVIIRCILISRLQLLKEEHFREEIVLDTFFNNSWPILIDKLKFLVIVLYPLSLRRNLSLHVSVLLINITLNVSQVLDFDQNSTEKAQVMSSFTEAYHATEHIVTSLLLV